MRSSSADPESNEEKPSTKLCNREIDEMHITEDEKESMEESNITSREKNGLGQIENCKSVYSLYCHKKDTNCEIHKGNIANQEGNEQINNKNAPEGRCIDTELQTREQDECEGDGFNRTEVMDNEKEISDNEKGQGSDKDILDQLFRKYLNTRFYPQQLSTAGVLVCEIPQGADTIIQNLICRYSSDEGTCQNNIVEEDGTDVNIDSVDGGENHRQIRDQNTDQLQNINDERHEGTISNQGETEQIYLDKKTDGHVYESESQAGERKGNVGKEFMENEIKEADDVKCQGNEEDEVGREDKRCGFQGNGVIDNLDRDKDEEEIHQGITAEQGETKQRYNVKKSEDNVENSERQIPEKCESRRGDFKEEVDMDCEKEVEYLKTKGTTDINGDKDTRKFGVTYIATQKLETIKKRTNKTDKETDGEFDKTFTELSSDTCPEENDTDGKMEKVGYSENIDKKEECIRKEKKLLNQDFYLFSIFFVMIIILFIYYNTTATIYIRQPSLHGTRKSHEIPMILKYGSHRYAHAKGLKIDNNRLSIFDSNSVTVAVRRKGPTYVPLKPQDKSCLNETSMISKYDSHKNAVAIALKFGNNSIFHNNITVGAVIFHRPTYVPPEPQDELEELPPSYRNGSINESRHVSRNTNDFSANDRQEHTVRILSENNSSRHVENRNDTPGDYISLRNSRQMNSTLNTLNDRDYSTMSSPSLGSRNSRNEQASVIFHIVQCQDYPLPFTGTSFLTQVGILQPFHFTNI